MSEAKKKSGSLTKHQLEKRIQGIDASTEIWINTSGPFGEPVYRVIREVKLSKGDNGTNYVEILV